MENGTENDTDKKKLKLKWHDFLIRYLRKIAFSVRLLKQSIEHIFFKIYNILFSLITHLTNAL